MIRHAMFGPSLTQIAWSYLTYNGSYVFLILMGFKNKREKKRINPQVNIEGVSQSEEGKYASEIRTRQSRIDLTNLIVLVLF